MGKIGSIDLFLRISKMGLILAERVLVSRPEMSPPLRTVRPEIS